MPPPYLGFFGWGLVGGLGDLPLFGTFGAFASLCPLSFLVCCLDRKGACWVGVGGQVTTAMVGEEPPIWAVSRASRSGVFFSNSILSGMLVASWSALTCAGRRWW